MCRFIGRQYPAWWDICRPSHFRIHSARASGPAQTLPSLAITHTSLTSRLVGSTSASGTVRSFSRTMRRKLRLAACFSSFSLAAAAQPMIGTCRRERATRGIVLRRGPGSNAGAQASIAVRSLGSLCLAGCAALVERDFPKLLVYGSLVSSQVMRVPVMAGIIRLTFS